MTEKIERKQRHCFNLESGSKNFIFKNYSLKSNTSFIFVFQIIFEGGKHVCYRQQIKIWKK